MEKCGISYVLVVAAYIERMATDRHKLIHAIDIARTPFSVLFYPSREKNIFRLFFRALNILITESSLTILNSLRAQTDSPSIIKIHQIVTVI